MRWGCRISTVLCGALACFAANSQTASASQTPKSIASIDYCSDQYVLALAPHDQIAALSQDATSVYSFFSDAARGIRQTRGNVEEILALSPAMLVRQWRGTPAIDTMVERAGIDATVLPFTTTVDDAFQSLLDFGHRIGREAAAQEFVSKRMALREKLRESDPLELKALYVTPSGFTAGAGTGVDGVIKQAGLDTMAQSYGLTGWGPLPLEAIVRDRPDVIITSFFDLPRPPSNWSLSGHPRIAAMLQDLPVINLPARYMTCHPLFAVDAAARIREDAERLGQQRADSARSR